MCPDFQARQMGFKLAQTNSNEDNNSHLLSFVIELDMTNLVPSQFLNLLLL